MANLGENKFRKRGETRERNDELFEGGNVILDSMLSPMFSGLNKEQEMSVMVSALAHVVAGDDVSEEAVEGAAGRGGGGGGSSSACKRGREDQQSSVIEQLPESVARVCRGFSHLPIGNTTFTMGASSGV